MPTLNIEGRKVTVDESFMKLAPEQQNATVEEIAKSFATPKAAALTNGGPSITDAVTDIPNEVGNAYMTAIQHATGNSVNDLPGYDPRTRGQLGPIEGLMRTGKQILGVPETLLSPITGAARSLIGHPMAQATQAVGSLINPEVAAKQDPQQLYETAKGDVDLAMSAARPAGAPIKVAGPATTQNIPSATGQTQVTTSAKPAYEWQHPQSAPSKAPAPTIEELDASATKNYNSPAVKDLEVKPQTLGRYSDETQISLNRDGFDENVAPITFSILGKLTKAPAGSIVTGDNLNSVRKLLGKAAAAGGEEGNAASRAIDALDDFVPKISRNEVVKGDVGAAAQAWEQARGDYSAARQAEKIDNKRVSAEIRAAAVNAGQNVAGRIRQNMAAVADPTTPKNARGLLPEEVAGARSIAEGTRTQNILRNVGDALGGGGGIRAGVLGVGGAILGGAPGAAIPLVGHVLRAISNKLTIRQAEKLSEAIRSRAPLASSSAKFNQAAAQVQANRTPQAIAGAVLAARNLSTNLRSAGFNIAPADLLSGLQSPSSGGAQEQNDVPRPPGQ